MPDPAPGRSPDGSDRPPRDRTRMLTGVGVSPGVRAGPVRTMTGSTPKPPTAAEAPGRRWAAERSHGEWPGGDREAERMMAVEALHAVADDLRARGRRAAAAGNRDAQDVLDAQALMATDPVLAQEIAARAEAGVPATQAVHQVFAAHRETLAGAGRYLAGRVADLDDIRDRTLAHLLGRTMPDIPDSDRPFVLVATDLAPAETALLDPAKVIAFVTEQGGPTSHSAILARSMGIPAVVACTGCRELTDGTAVIVDGASGQVLVSPPSEEIRAAGGWWSRDEAPGPRTSATLTPPGGSPAPHSPAPHPSAPHPSAPHPSAPHPSAPRPLAAPTPPGTAGTAGAPREARRPGGTADGHRVALFANIGGVGDLDAAVAYGAEGVGLFRTEFLFLGRSAAPGVDEQEAAYRRAFETFPQGRVVVRVLDAGADKPLAFLPPLDEEPNPALGERGLRLLRRHPEVLTDQLTALARAAAGLPVEAAVMAPMVSGIEDTNFFVEACRRAGLARAGIMIETPAAALRARDLTGLVDFVSIGTNDLAQYTFAADRQLRWSAGWQDPWQPALHDLIAVTAAAAAASRRECGVCGEAAADPALACVLVGLGVTSLSMTATSLSAVRAALAVHTLEQCRAAATAARGADSATSARAAAYADLPNL